MDDHLGTCRACTSVRFDRGAPSPKWWKPPGPNLPPSEPSSRQSCAMSLISPSPFVPSTCANLWKQGWIQFLPPTGGCTSLNFNQRQERLIRLRLVKVASKGRKNRFDQRPSVGFFFPLPPSFFIEKVLVRKGAPILHKGEGVVLGKAHVETRKRSEMKSWAALLGEHSP